MPKYHVNTPSRERRHTYRFSQSEVIAALVAAIDESVGKMPQGKRSLWGLETVKLNKGTEGLTLVIDEPI